MKAFGTFKGGGVKGLAHVGAYKAARDRGIEFVGVSGTSAGSIVAALIAVGYSPDELFDAAAQDAATPKPFEEPYTNFFDMDRWDSAERAFERMNMLMQQASPAENDTKISKQNQRDACVSLAYLIATLLKPHLAPVVKEFFVGRLFIRQLKPQDWLSFGGVLLVLMLLFIWSNIWGRILLTAVICLTCIKVGTDWRTLRRQTKQEATTRADFEKVLKPIWEDRGLFSTDAFAQWLDTLLRKKLERQDDRPILFRDIKDRMPLKIVAADVTNHRVFVFSQEDTPDVPIIEAVASSICIPFVFKPRIYERTEQLDGGLVSNMPAWALDDERDIMGIGTPTLVFNLEELDSNSNRSSIKSEPPLQTWRRFLKDIATTTLEGGASLQYRQVGNLHIIPMPVGAGLLAIKMTHRERCDLYREGNFWANKYLVQIVGPRSPKEMENVILKDMHETFLAFMDKKDAHLRIAVLLRLCKNSSEDEAHRKYVLKVCYRYNMDEDADDQMELDIPSGGAGACWRSRKETFVNMEQARNNYKTVYGMTKYQQALVRPTLCGLLCIPIFAPVRDKEVSDVQAGNSTEPLLGVLAFDTDNQEIRDIFERVCSSKIVDHGLMRIKNKAVTYAIILANYLKS